MKTKKLVSTISMLLSGFTFNAYAINNAPADVDSVTLRTSCTQGGIEITNCFTTMDDVNNWLLNVRNPSAIKPTIINIGPGTFDFWSCSSSNVTLRGSGRDQTVISAASGVAAITISEGCTNLNVQDLTVDSRDKRWGVFVSNLKAITSWTNVEIIAEAYGWDERFLGTVDGSGDCTVGDRGGKHMWFSSRIRTTGFKGTSSRAYTARCAQSWFWGSEITAGVTEENANAKNAMITFALKAEQAEVHIYGSNVRLLLPNAINALGYQSPTSGHFLLAATKDSAIHIHGTGLDVVHPGTGTADMLYADSTSHFHANESAFNIHVSGAGKVSRIAGTPNRIEAPYTWKQGTQPPLSTTLDGTTPTINGTATLISVSGADSYIETDCPVDGNCSLGGDFPHQMVYRKECTTNTTANGGPWFDLTTKACRG